MEVLVAMYYSFFRCSKAIFVTHGIIFKHIFFFSEFHWLNISTTLWICTHVYSFVNEKMLPVCFTSTPLKANYMADLQSHRKRVF